MKHYLREGDMVQISEDDYQLEYDGKHGFRASLGPAPCIDVRVDDVLRECYWDEQGYYWED